MIIQRLTLLAIVVAAICCVVAIAAFLVQPPARKSAPVGLAAKADAAAVAHHPSRPLRTIPIGKTTPPDVKPAPQSASVTPQEQELPPSRKPDPAQRSRTERTEASDSVCGERGRYWFTDRPGHRSWRCNR